MKNAKVDTTVASGSGPQCIKGLSKDKAAEAFANVDKTQMMQCVQLFKANESDLKTCFEKTFPKGSNNKSQ